MKVLAIDTSTYVMGVAITSGNVVLGEWITNIKKNHSIRLMPAISQLMEEVGVKPNELDRIIVANGPGSYTGVRIGVTTAKSMAWALNIPIVGVSSLEVMAQNGRFFPGLICPIIDARRGQVYTGLYEADQTNVINKAENKLVMFCDWLEEIKEYNKQVLFIGNDLDLHKDLIIGILGDQAVFPTNSMQNPRPSELAMVGLHKSPAESVHTFVPEYLQLAEAEAKWIEANKNAVSNDE